MSEPDDLRQARERVAGERASVAGTVAALGRDFDRIVAAAEGVATDDEHDPEGATIAFERAQVAALLARAREQLAALDRAADRIADGSYGTCEVCGRPIAAERLAALPATTSCIGCAGRRTP
jgi:DnaK suppressor protein